MDAIQPQLKRRAILERDLESKYFGKLVGVLHNNESKYGRIQVIGIEWEGKNSYTVTITLDSKRLQFDYEFFIQTTKIL